MLVDGMPLDDLSVKDLSKLLRGPVGTSVELHLKRRGISNTYFTTDPCLLLLQLHLKRRGVSSNYFTTVRMCW